MGLQCLRGLARTARPELASAGTPTGPRRWREACEAGAATPSARAATLRARWSPGAFPPKAGARRRATEVVDDGLANVAA